MDVKKDAVPGLDDEIGRGVLRGLGEHGAWVERGGDGDLGLWLGEGML